jgi:hypothetical protein
MEDMGVALSNIQLQTIINNSVDNPDYLLLKNDIRIQRAKEKNKKNMLEVSILEMST